VSDETSRKIPDARGRAGRRSGTGLGPDHHADGHDHDTADDNDNHDARDYTADDHDHHHADNQPDDDANDHREHQPGAVHAGRVR
jgi:hypothetical protein